MSETHHISVIEVLRRHARLEGLLNLGELHDGGRRQLGLGGDNACCVIILQLYTCRWE